MRTLGAALVLGCIVVACNTTGAPPSAPTSAAAPVTTVTINEGARQGSPSSAGPATSVAAADPPPSPAGATSGVTSAAPASAGDAGGDFYTCNADSDCVAVPKVACCPTGHLEAVNKQSVNAYQSSLVCETKHRLCPQYRIMDKRQAVCGTSSHKCEMMMPDQITCIGAGGHTCPPGFTCDSNGHCKAGGGTP